MSRKRSRDEIETAVDAILADKQQQRKLALGDLACFYILEGPWLKVYVACKWKRTDQMIYAITLKKYSCQKSSLVMPERLETCKLGMPPFIDAKDSPLGLEGSTSMELVALETRPVRLQAELRSLSRKLTKGCFQLLLACALSE